MAGVKGLRPCLGLLGKGDWPLSTRAAHEHALADSHPHARAQQAAAWFATCIYVLSLARSHARARSFVRAHVQEAIREPGRGLLLAGRAVLSALAESGTRLLAARVSVYACERARVRARIGRFSREARLFLNDLMDSFIHIRRRSRWKVRENVDPEGIPAVRRTVRSDCPSEEFCAILRRPPSARIFRYTLLREEAARSFGQNYTPALLLCRIIRANCAYRVASRSKNSAHKAALSRFDVCLQRI